MAATALSQSEAAELEAALRGGIKGEVALDPVTLGIYSTDASIYQQPPLAVVTPVDAADARFAVKAARERKLPILARGGGTSLAGQATLTGVIIDFSKHMNRLLEVNEAERWARVEPGRVRDELNALIVKTGLHFAPETATSNRANVGGMIANNSSGLKSIIYGKTIDHVLELKLLLATGEEMHARAMPRSEWDAIASRDDREGRIYRRVREIIEENRDEIAARYPKVMRRVGGYNLDAFPEAGPWNLASLIVGSEGTLATVLEAKLKLEPIPKAKAVCVAHFKEILEALRATVAIVPHGPSAVEILDNVVVSLARNNLETRRITEWVVGDPAAVLLIEFFGDTMDEVKARFDRLIPELKAKGLGYAHPLMIDAAEQQKVWSVRAAGLGLMLGMKGEAKPTPFIEDAAVPVEVLPEYIDSVLKVCKSIDVPVSMYAHASVGLIHVRPILNLKLAGDIEKMKQISERTFELVRKHGGSWSGEHGDGLVRSYMNERYFGPKLYAAFKEIKRLFDPEGLMNPGKIVDAPPMDQTLRYGAQYRVPPPQTHYRYRGDGGYAAAVEMCTGVGACRKTGAGTMCPSYMATRDEAHSTRGRANALRLAMSGQLGADGMTSEGMHEVMDLCLGCKGCKAECPSNVDLAKLKGEFLAAYHAKHGRTVGERFFAGGPAASARFAGAMAPLANWMNAQGWFRALLEKATGLDRRRPVPKLAAQTFPQWFAGRGGTGGGLPATAPRVVLFDDTFMNYHEPSIGRAAVLLFEKLGYRVQLARAGCCGRPLISHGFLDEAKKQGKQMMSRLQGYLNDGLPVVVAEPSCASALTDDLPDLIDMPRTAARIAQGAISTIDVFLEREIAEGRLGKDKLAAAGASAGEVPRFLIHGHCHQKALYGTAAMKSVLGAIPGAKVEEIGSGCCGMAGSFGYEKPHYDLSMKIGEDRLFPAVRAMAPGTRLVASGFSCRHQIADGAGAKGKHFVEALYEAVSGSEA